MANVLSIPALPGIRNTFLALFILRLPRIPCSEARGDIGIVVPVADEAMTILELASSLQNLGRKDPISASISRVSRPL